MDDLSQIVGMLMLGMLAGGFLAGFIAGLAFAEARQRASAAENKHDK